jgi:hypothetical protein
MKLDRSQLIEALAAGDVKFVAPPGLEPEFKV